MVLCYFFGTGCLLAASSSFPLWDDAFAYAAALEREGVRVQVLDYPGQIHAFLSLRKVIPQGNDALARCAVWLKDVMAANAKRDADAA